VKKVIEAPKSSAKASTKKAKRQAIRLTRIKQWYIPADAESYIALKDVGVAMTRIHQNFLPTVGLMTRKYGITAREVNFKNEIMDPFFEQIANSWNRKLHCRCLIGGRTMKFESTKPEAHKEAVAAIPKLQDLLEKFFSRWGFSSTFDYSEARGKCKLNVEYWFDHNKAPIVVLEEAPEDQPKIQWKLGFTRLTFTFDQYHSKSVKLPPPPGQQESGREHRIGYVHLLVEVSQGGKFTPVHSTKCTYTELSSVLPLMKALMNVPNMDHHNFDNLPD
jgi:hypothetical protein